MWRRWGTSENFFFLFIFLLMNLKNNYLLKKLLKWANKTQKNFNIYNVSFFKKITKTTERFHYFTLVYKKPRWYDLQFLRYRAWRDEIGNFRNFLPFYPSKNSKIKNFEKMKKFAEDIIIWHTCTKTSNHMMSSSWDTGWERHNFLRF